MNIHSVSLPFVEIRSNKEARSKAIGYMALIVLILASSTYPAFGKKLTTAFTPLSMMFISEFLAGFFALLSFGIVPTLRQFIHLKQKQVIPLAMFAFTNGIIGPFLWFQGLSSTAAINADLFGRSEMVLLVLFSVVLLREPLKRAHMIGGSIILLGVLTVALRGFSNGIVLQSGDVLIFLSSVAFASGSTILRKYLYQLEPQVIICARSFAAIGLFFTLEPFVRETFGEELMNLPESLILALFGFGFISRFMSNFGFYEAVERLPIATVSLTATLSIVGSMIFVNLYLGSPVHIYQMIGGGLIVIGALVIQIVGLHKNEKHLSIHMHSHQRHHL